MSRLPAAVALEARVEWRYGIVAAAGALALLWTLVLLAVPAEGARVLAPYLLFLDTAGFGALLVVALLLFERGEGTRAALTATPLRTGESVAARLIVLVALSLAIAAPMPAAALRGRLDEVARALAPVLLGVAVTSLLLLTLCLAIGARARTLQGFLLAMPPALVPLIAVPMLHASGVVEHPVMYAVPTTVGADLIRLGVRPGSVEAGPALVALGLGYALLWIAAGAVAAHRAIESGAAAAPRPGRARVRALARPGRPSAAVGRGAAGPGAAARTGAMPPVLRFARVDLLGVGRDPMLLVLLLAPALLAVALRFGYPPAVEHVRSSYGFDLAPHTPAALAAFVLLHVPMMFGVAGGLRAVEDIDEHVLPALRVSPLSLGAYFGYRMLVTALATLAGLAAALPISAMAGAADPADLAAAVLLASLQAPVLLLAMTALAGNKVEALVVVKGAGAVLVLVPVAMWVLPGGWWWPLLALSPAWPVLALPGYSDAGPHPLVSLAVGTLVTAATAAVLIRRTWRRLDAG
ncbi:fluoroquinolone transport system permease protein [Spinactinospora alkalitolerans]|uniref:Fluoroquinolone transport system permease protein n=1 Tax=Spinactinospora alkalitolerans TaxID=687207 RepID=A0A852U8W3_9ACTN|nr:hypothetical protein [Spinactinospora alkalitolerans]NYE50544.1 fluoroquinolone transport system permease protein [Spinactinospora alkalitolerans]